MESGSYGPAGLSSTDKQMTPEFSSLQIKGARCAITKTRDRSQTHCLKAGDNGVVSSKP